LGEKVGRELTARQLRKEAPCKTIVQNCVLLRYMIGYLPSSDGHLSLKPL